MDVDKDATLSEEDFVKCCLQDKTIFEILAIKKCNYLRILDKTLVVF